jgi:hypothetical protein
MQIDLDNLTPEQKELLKKLLSATNQSEDKPKRGRKKKEQEKYLPSFDEKKKVNGPASFKQEWKDPGTFKEDVEIDKLIKRTVSERNREQNIVTCTCTQCKCEFEALSTSEFLCDDCILGRK